MNIEWRNAINTAFKEWTLKVIPKNIIINAAIGIDLRINSKNLK